jgi:hypothetical protein
MHMFAFRLCHSRMHQHVNKIPPHTRTRMRPTNTRTLIDVLVSDREPLKMELSVIFPLLKGASTTNTE